MAEEERMERVAVTASRERPILFTAPMVRAILAGSKTRTRRIVKPDWLRCLDPDDEDDHRTCLGRSPYQPGMVLWVKESYCPDPLRFAADWYGEWFGQPAACRPRYPSGVKKWTPSIFMRREHSRIDLDVVSVRLVRVQNMTEADARDEGVESLAEYKMLWDKINGAGSWAANPWVWDIEFRRRS